MTGKFGGTVNFGGDPITGGGIFVAKHAPDAVPCPADVNGDEVVDVLDLVAVLVAWGPCAGCAEDINGDSVVNVLDLVEVLVNWGPCA